jgi:DNA replication protein DnaC
MSFPPPVCKDMTRETWTGEWPLPEWSGDPWAITLLGPTGTGKTHAATALWRMCLNTGTFGYFGWWFSVAKALDKIREEILTGTSSKTKAKMMSESLVLLDEVGGEKPTDFTLDAIRGVLTHRYNYQLPTIITSNAATLEVLEKIDPRVASRLAEGEVITLDGPDWIVKR